MSPGGAERQASRLKMCLACNRQFEGVDFQACPNDGTALIALQQASDCIGQVIGGNYYVTEKIGQGGMGVVYLARHQMMDRLVAIKMLQSELLSDELSVKRFTQEAQAASCLNHPHIITLYDFGVMPNKQPYLVMEYLEGVPLLHVIKRGGAMEPTRAVKIFSEVADALQHAHTQGIVHRDMKPSNIILINKGGDKDFVKVVDFGLAKMMPWSGKESQHLTKTGEVFGSPIYMSPEQCMGRALGPTSDVYSVAITLFEALTGRPPFRGQNSIQTATKHMTEDPPRFADVRPDLLIPESLERVIAKALAKEPADRFQDMTTFRDALQGTLKGESIEMPPSLAVSRHAIPAVQDKTVSVSLSKADVQKLSASAANLRAITPTNAAAPKKNLVPVLVGVALAIAAAGGGIAWALLHPTPEHITGMVTFADMPHKLIEITDESNRIHRLSVPDPRPNELRDFNDKDNSTALAVHLDIDYDTHPLENPLDGAVTKATGRKIERDAHHRTQMAKEFLEFIARGDYREAATLWNLNGKGAERKAAEEEKRNQLMLQLPPRELAVLSNRIPGVNEMMGERTPPPTVAYRPLSAYKLTNVTGDSLSILVSKAAYYADGKLPASAKPYWKIDIQEDKIVGMSDVDQQVWDNN